MTDALEAPRSPDEVYLARGDEVTGARPLLTGDIVLDVEIPGLDDGAGPAIVLSHPCGMRQGPVLASRVLVARIHPHDEIPLEAWTHSHYKLMPLPFARIPVDPGHCAARYEDIGMVRSEVLEAAERVVCLSRKGINLLQQRFIWHLTRFAVPTDELDQVAAAVFEEVDLAEEWIGAAIEAGLEAADAYREFHDWVRSPDSSGLPRQDGLTDPQRTPTIRRDLRSELIDRYAPG